SEVYLLLVARRFLGERYDEQRPERKDFLGHNFDALRTRLESRNTDYRHLFQKAEDCYRILRKCTGPWLDLFLLEWAAVVPRQVQECETILASFHALVKQPDQARVAIGDRSKPVERETYDYTRVCQRLLAFAKRELDK